MIRMNFAWFGAAGEPAVPLQVYDAAARWLPPSDLPVGSAGGACTASPRGRGASRLPYWKRSSCQTAQRATVKISLRVGQVTETMTITERTPLLASELAHENGGAARD